MRRPGERIGDFEILTELGRGGMGVVYQARQCSLKRLVALKMILAGAHTDPTARARFRTEAEAVARLQHPNIIQIYEVGEHDGAPFLSLEYLAGGSLDQKVADTAQPERQAALLVETLARAIHHTHERGILHRDLKPTNILLMADGTPKITDFGLAKLVDQGGGPTRSETLLGTPSYMSPEHLAGDSRKVGVTADVYGLGAILYELLTGRPPFRGATVLNTLEQVRTQEPVPPRRLRGPTSRDLETICLKCLEKEPGNRYASAEALADDLRRFLEGEPVQARPIAAWQRLWRSARRRPTLLARALGAVALLCVLLTCLWYFRVADQLARYDAEERYQQFVQRRNEALFYGLLAPDQGGLFLGAEAVANRKAAESAAREALALVAMRPDSEAPAVDAPVPAERRADVAADCYTLLLVLASVRGQQAPPPAAAARELEGGDERQREALQLLDRARTLGFQTRAYHLRRAQLLEQAGKSGEARAETERAHSLPPESALDHFLIGEEQYRRGDWEGARDSFNQALSRHPGHFWAQFLLAVSHLQARQWEAAKVGLNACLSQQPDFVWAYLFRSIANERLQALKDAEGDFQTALRLNPNEDARYVLLLTRGILHFKHRDLERAAADFRKACALKPEQYNAYLNLAQVYLAQREFEQAAAQVSRAVRLRPPVQVMCGYHVERGWHLLRDKNYEEARRASEVARELCPEQPSPFDLRARALLQLGRYQEAEGAFDQYLRTGGEAVADVFRGRGQARMRQGKYAEAAEDYSRALERAPDGDLYQHRGWAHFFADAWKLALRDFGQAIALAPEASDAYTGRGLARVMLGDYRAAVADAEKALQHKPRTPEMMHNIACIFAQAVARAENQQAPVDSYRSRALEALRQTLQMLPPEERLFFWQDKILRDAALAPICNAAEFQGLQAECVPPR